jgi:hypothetical protein
MLDLGFGWVSCGKCGIKCVVEICRRLLLAPEDMDRDEAERVLRKHAEAKLCKPTPPVDRRP